MMVSKVPEDSGSEEEQKLVVRAKVVETKIRGLQKSLRKECARIRMRGTFSNMTRGTERLC